ncbi:MAG TPA: electron transfer flavoprotein subunit beta/FixA family protein [Kiritimatiellia bacterium]|nr:electron transfer flavoprotein subunit beta/FixA family protein [Kiritimatiellia bacterium]
MHIVVCVKQVPNTTQVRINPETNTLVREGVESIMNPFDENALEMALQLKEQHAGTKVTVLTMGPPQAAEVLKEAVGRGADAVVLLSDRAFAGSDTWATSYALSMAIRQMEKPDLILFGKQAIDGDTAQVGPGVADWLDLPCIAYARKIEVANGVAQVERAYEDGYEKLEVALPCVLTVLKEANVPRMASLRGKMAAKKLSIVPLTAEGVGADPAKLGLNASPTRVVKIFSPPPKTGGVKWQGEEPAVMAQRLADVLRERKLI